MATDNAALQNVAATTLDMKSTGPLDLDTTAAANSEAAVVMSSETNIMPSGSFDVTTTQDDEVDWLECISAMETNQGLLYFCDAQYQRDKNIGGVTEFKATYPEGTHLYSITGYNPYNKITNRVQNELMNHFLLEDLRMHLPGCNITRNFSYFPSRPYHFERGYTIQIPPDYRIYNHGMVIYSLSIKYEQAAFFKGVVLSSGVVRPYVVLVQGEYTEIKEELVMIPSGQLHPAFIHKANNAIFNNLPEALNLLYQTREQIPLCAELYDLYLENYKPISEVSGANYPIIAVEGNRSFDTAHYLSKLMDSWYCGNTPKCLKGKRPQYEHSTMLLALFKTIADYLQSCEISKRARSKPVIVNKYWYNTAASLIVSEVNTGSRNLPPRDHHVYRWPEGLLKPDAVVLLDKKFRTSTGEARQKLKSSCLKRMQDERWFTFNCKSSNHVDVVGPRILDQLTNKGVIKMKGRIKNQGMCPASSSSPLNILRDDSYDRGSTKDPIPADYNVTESFAKPFWG